MEAPSRPFVAPRAVSRGRPHPLGATWDGSGVNFALYSERAERVELCLFEPKGRREIERIELPERTDHVWHCYLPEARPGQIYAYRVHGPAGARNTVHTPKKILASFAPTRTSPASAPHPRLSTGIFPVL